MPNVPSAWWGASSTAKIPSTSRSSPEIREVETGGPDVRRHTAIGRPDRAPRAAGPVHAALRRRRPRCVRRALRRRRDAAARAGRVRARAGRPAHRAGGSGGRRRLRVPLHHRRDHRVHRGPHRARRLPVRRAPRPWPQHPGCGHLPRRVRAHRRRLALRVAHDLVLLHGRARDRVAGDATTPRRTRRDHGRILMHAGLRIVDADGHYAEPADVFDGRLDAKHLERAPRVLRMDNGRQGMSFLGNPPAVGLFGSGDAIVPGGIQNPEFRDWDDGTPGAFDPLARLKDMDAEGVDAAVLFPTLGLFAPLVPDPESEREYCRALNDFYAEYCAADPARLHGVAMLPLKDVDGAIAETQRAAERGFVAVCLRPNPDQHTKHAVADGRYEPLWSAVEETGLAACL